MPEATAIWEESNNRDGFQSTIEQLFAGDILNAIKTGVIPPLDKKPEAGLKAQATILLLPQPKKK